MLKSFAYIKEFIKTLPEKSGVYRMVDSQQKVLYVGKARNLKKRVTNYSTPLRLNNRLIRMVEQVVSIEIITTKSEAEALLLEASLIKSLKPKYNILLRDDKSFPYIYIRNDHDFPQILKYRGNKKEKGQYFGPFASSRDVTHAISELQKIFLLRTCTDTFFENRKRPCLEYQIKRCSAPCTGFISKEDYNNSVSLAYKFLKGESNELLDDLITQMEQASNNLEYEKAAWLRDRIKALNLVRSRNQVNLSGESDVDVISVYKTGKNICIQIFFFRAGQNYGNKPYFPAHVEECENKEVLGAFIGQFYQNRVAPPVIWLSDEIEEQKEIASILSEFAGYKVSILNPKKGEPAKILELAYENAKSALLKKLSVEEKNINIFTKIQQEFNLPKEINRIEVYDNSHISGTNAVGAMVVIGKEGFIKDQYKKFNIKTNASKTGGDDYQMLREVLTRRISRLLKESPEYEENIWPDLMLIDGGKGHVGIVEEVMHYLNVKLPYVCIAKGKERNAGKEKFFNDYLDGITFEKHEDIMKFLQVIRDEAHRFAIGSHRKRRSAELSKSKIDDIPNIGAKRKKILLNHFGSFDAVRNCSVDDLMNVPGISKIIAKQVYGYLHEDK